MAMTVEPIGLGFLGRSIAALQIHGSVGRFHDGSAGPVLETSITEHPCCGVVGLRGVRNSLPR